MEENKVLKEGNFIFSGMVVAKTSGVSKKSGKPYSKYKILIGDAVYTFFSSVDFPVVEKQDIRGTMNIDHADNKVSYILKTLA